MYVAPPILLFLGSHLNITDDHMASIRVICNGAGPVSQSDADRVLNRFKSKFFISQGKLILINFIGNLKSFFDGTVGIY